MMLSAKSRQEGSDLIYSSLRDDPDFVELLLFFVDELPQTQNVLRGLGQTCEFNEVRREAHKLRGSAGGYGFPELSDLAGRLEDSCKNPLRDETAILRNLDELLHYLGKVRT